MDPLKAAVVLATGLALSGCAGTLDSLSASSGQDVYSTPGYYGTPAYPVQGYYAQPGYAAPSYPPGYVTPYVIGPGSGEGRERWREHEWREHKEHTFQDEGRQPFGLQRQDARQVPQMAAQPRSMGPTVPPPQMAPRPPPAAGPQVDQNRQLLNQLGFRPSR